MAAPRQGLNPTTNSVGFTAKLVTVRSVSADGSTAVVVDRQNTQTQVPMLVQRGRAPLPVPGESWLISQDLGMWTFAAFVGTSGADFAPQPTAPTAWHNMTLRSGWGLGSGGYAQYRPSPSAGRVLIRGSNIVVGTPAGGTSIWTPAPGCAPSAAVAAQRVVMIVENSTGSAGAETPRFDITTTGLEIWNVPAGTTRIGFNDSYALDLPGSAASSPRKDMREARANR
jgi:hypothetical protein